MNYCKRVSLNKAVTTIRVSLLCLFAFGCLVVPQVVSAASVPNGFVLDKIVSGLARPSSLLALPDGRLLIGEQKTGRIKVYKNGSILGTVYAKVATVNGVNNEAGLLGLVADPNFSGNGYVYVFVTHDAKTSRVWRYKTVGDKGTSPKLIVSGIERNNVVHNGGGLAFGPDGKLYIAVGDGGTTRQWAQDLKKKAGKILRVNPSGTAASGNPFGSMVWSYGHRHPFRLTFQPGTGRLYVSENGPAEDDELNLINKGGNYGWPNDTGPNSDPKFVDPVHTWKAIVAPTDLQFYQGSVLPLNKELLVVEYKHDRIRRYKLSADGKKVVSGPTGFVSGVDRPIDIEQGSDGNLYFTTHAGSLYRVKAKNTGNASPTASFLAVADTGKAPFTVNVDAATSTDSDGNIVSYKWTWGDGTSGSGKKAAHIYNHVGNYKIKLTVTDNKGATGTTDLEVVATGGGNGAPSAHIETTSPGSVGKAPFKITFSGHGHDPDDDLLEQRWNFGDGSDPIVIKDVPSDKNREVSHTYVKAGTFTAVLTVEDPDGRKNSNDVELEISAPAPPPNAKPTSHIVSVSPGSSGTAPFEVKLVGQGRDPDGDRVTHIWDFGDGRTKRITDISSERKRTATHIYENPGTFTATLTVQDPDGLKSSTDTVIKVTKKPEPPANKPPTSTIKSVSPDSSGTAPFEVEFIGQGSDPENGSLTHTWDFGDGSSMALTGVPSGDDGKIAHTYEKAGTFTAILTIKDSEGLTDSSEVVVKVAPKPTSNKPPTSTIESVSPDSSGTAPFEVNLVGQGSDPEGKSLTHIWDFGDGGKRTIRDISSDAKRTATHTYENPGTFTATLTVEDPDGLTGSSKVTIKVAPKQGEPPNAPPSSTIVSVSPDSSGTAPFEVKLVGQGSDPDGDRVTHIWDFGDGRTKRITDISSERKRTATHIYENPGTFTATLTVQDPDGLTDSSKVTIKVAPKQGEPPNAPPRSTIESVSPGPAGTAPFEVKFSGLGSDPDGGLLTHTWDFGDGSQQVVFDDIPADTKSDVSHRYVQAGTFTATLTIEDPSGLTSSSDTIVRVSPDELRAGSVIEITPINDGIAVGDNATGSGFILYSKESVHTRLSGNAPQRNNSDHLIAVQHDGVKWWYNNNSEWFSFDPHPTDVLLATVDFESDEITSLEGSSGTEKGMKKGYASGNLVFKANQGDFVVSGTYFSHGNPLVMVVSPVRAGIAVDDSAQGTGFILYSEESVHTRLAGSNPVDPRNSDHLIVVQHDGVKWWYNNNSEWFSFVPGWYSFTPRPTDILIATVDFDADAVKSLQRSSGSEKGIKKGYVEGNLEFESNMWDGNSNVGEFTVNGSYFTRANP